jgi:hypothetical protein
MIEVYMKGATRDNLPSGHICRIDRNGGVWVELDSDEVDSYMDECAVYHIVEKPMTVKELYDSITKKYPKKSYMMDTKTFNILASDIFEMCKYTLISKGKGYDPEEERLRSFHTAGRIAKQSPEKALLGMALKHEVSIRDIVNDLDNGKIPTDDVVKEKIGDMICYLVLLLALIKERRGGKP